ncbi:MAG: L-ribulose-5-phosphate 4-epimerase [Ruminiclostridium sp.]|nr:L-ribulose-5-phosphate 4-epimerase [Ruminiclostridium sp.]MBR5452985.1 L-ribulose-5-phosphate 4-epimerase [Clostridia bacterium]
MLENLKELVCKANLDLVKYKVVIFTWGNVSAIDRETGLVVIKPSGVDYSVMKPEHMVVVDLDGNVVDGDLNPSTDMPTHLEIYKAFPDVGGVVHTHSLNATAWAQAGRDIPLYGTTHADYFHGAIPCARALTTEEINGEYEKNTGLVIAEKIGDTPALTLPGALVKSHGVFSWGKDADNAVHNAVVIEAVAEMAMKTEIINPRVTTADDALIEKHYNRKHGKNAYYGQKKI